MTDFAFKIEGDASRANAAIDDTVSGLAEIERKAKTASQQAQRAFDTLGATLGDVAKTTEQEARMFERATGKSKDFGFQLAALQKLHNEGKISGDQYIKTLQKMGVEFDHTAKQAEELKRAQAQQAMNTINLPSAPSGGGAMGLINKAGGALAAAAGASALAHAAIEANDRWVDLENSVRKFETPGRSAGTVLHDIGSLAHDLHQPLEQTIALFDGVEGATKDLGLSQKEMTDISRTLGQVMLNDGKSIEAASGMMERLEYAMSVGSISGGELKKMMREFPDIADMWTSATGRTRAELVELADKGKLPIDVLITALGNGGAAAEKFAQRGKKLSDVWHEVSDALSAPINFDYINDQIDPSRQMERIWADFANDVEKARINAERLANAQRGLTGSYTASRLPTADDAAKRIASERIDAVNAAKLELEGLEKAYNQGFITEGIYLERKQPLLDIINGVTEAMKREREELRKFNEELNRGNQGRNMQEGPGPFELGLQQAQADAEAMRKRVLGLYTEDAGEARPGQAQLSDWAIGGIQNGQVEPWEDKVARANEDAAIAAEQAAQRYKEAWAAAAGSATASLLNMAAEGKVSVGEMVETIVRQLAMVAIQQAAVRMGGSGGAFLGGLAQAFAGQAHGAQWTVGGSGGTDSQLVAFRASPNERVTVETPQQVQAGTFSGGARGPTSVVVQMQNDRRDLVEGFDSRDGERVIARLDRRMGRRRR